jgi:hypothetical protein
MPHLTSHTLLPVDSLPHAGDNTPLRPIDSPVIRRVGDKSKLPPNNALTAGEWVQARYNNIPANYAKKREERMKEPTTVIKNIEVRTYA